MADVDGLKQRVKAILEDKGWKLEPYKDEFRVPHNSTTVQVQVEPWGDDHTVVKLAGLVAQYVPITDQLKIWVCEQTGGWAFGHVTYLEVQGKGWIEYRHILLGDFLDPDELTSALQVVADAADDLDDKIKDRFGGERWTDPHRTEPQNQ
jgi:hypothetical protein